MSSERLPGKVLADIEGEPMLSRILERLRSDRYDLMVATSDGLEDDPIQSLCETHGVRCFRGSRDDVLDRMFRAAKVSTPDIVIRFTADNPLVDREFTEMLLDDFETCDCDYLAPKGYPIGLAAEIVRYPVLEQAWQEATSQPDREHVTTYIYHPVERFRVKWRRPETELPPMRWTVDTRADLEFAREVYRRLGEGFSWRDVLELMLKHPELREINCHVAQKKVGE